MRIPLPAWKPVAALAMTGAVSLALLSSAGAQANQAPTPQNDTAATLEDTAVTIAVLGNDTDPDGNTLSIASVGLPSNGSVAISGNSVVYTPKANFHGTDSFNYAVTDGGILASALVTVTVAAVNDAPEAVNDSATVKKNEAKTIDVLSNDSDVDGDTLTLQAVSAPTHGTAVIASGKVIYTPATDYVGADAFTYVISDGTVTDTATVSVTVKEGTTRPVADRDAKVLAACAAGTGQPGLATLCGLYDRPDLPSWARHIIGKNILKIARLSSSSDRVLEVCATATAGSAVAQLCTLYQAEGTPAWLQAQVGKLVLKLSNAETGRDRSDIRDGIRDDVKKDKDHKQDKHEKKDKNKDRDSRGVLNVSFGGDDDDRRGNWSRFDRDDDRRDRGDNDRRSHGKHKRGGWGHR